MKSSFGIAVFHNMGGILLCTPIARQLKVDNPDCEVIWYASQSYKFILENNPFTDQIVPFDGDPLTLYESIPDLKSKRSWTWFFTSAEYMNREKTPGGSDWQNLSRYTDGDFDAKGCGWRTAEIDAQAQENAGDLS
jgi:hypothetical protein